MKNLKLPIFVRWFLEIIFFIGIFVVISVPYSGRLVYIEYFGSDARFYRYTSVLLVISGVLALIVIRLIINIMKSINKGNPFVYPNVTYLKGISVLSFILAACYVTKCFFYPTVLTFAIVGVFIVAGLICLVFSQLFKTATDIKNENDLTI